MKLSELIFRQPARVAFGQAMTGGGLTSVDLVASPTAASVIVTASDGSAAPIAGADAANAGVMTAADKVKLDGLALANTRDFASAADVAAASIGAEATHLRTTGLAATGDRGGALYARVGAQPAHGLKLQSADGAWWELMPEAGVVSFAACGAIEGDVAANGATNVAAFDAFIGFAQAWDNGQAGWTAGLTLHIPRGVWHFDAHLNVKAVVNIRGDAGFNDSGKGGTWLKWAQDTDGIIVHDTDTIDATTTIAGKTGAGSTIERIALKGAGPSTGTTGSGIWLRAPARIRDCLLGSWREHGVYVRADAGAGGSQEGNANLWRIENVKVTSNGRDGLHVEDDDANAGICIGLDAGLNGRWAIQDNSLLGNTYIGCHAATNGLATVGGNDATQSSFVTYLGTRYAANADATEADMVATTPGTDPAVWIPIAAGGPSGQIPTWVAAQPAGTYFAGGSYRTASGAASNILLGCYEENGQAPAQLVAPTIAMGMQSGNYGTGLVAYPGTASTKWSGKTSFSNDQTFWQNPDRALSLIVNSAKNQLLTLTASGDNPTGLGLANWQEDNKTWAIQHAGSNSKRYLQFTTDLTAVSFGRTSAPGGGWPWYALGFMLGGSGMGLGGARMQAVGTAAPASGEHARGDIVWNRDPAAGGVLAWVCTASGSPGTWTELRGPANQTSGANQAALTNSTGGAGDGTLSQVGNTSAQNQAGVINDNFTELHTLLDEVRTTLVGAGLMKGSA